MKTYEKPHRSRSQSAAGKPPKNKRETVTFEPSKQGLEVLEDWDKTGYDRTKLLNYYLANSTPEDRDKLVTNLKVVGIFPKTEPLIPELHNAADNGIVGVASSSLAGSTILTADVAVTSARNVDKLKNKIRLGYHVGQLRNDGAGHPSSGIAFAE